VSKAAKLSGISKYQYLRAVKIIRGEINKKLMITAVNPKEIVQCSYLLHVTLFNKKDVVIHKGISIMIKLKEIESRRKITTTTINIIHVLTAKQTTDCIKMNKKWERRITIGRESNIGMELLLYDMEDEDSDSSLIEDFYAPLRIGGYLKKGLQKRGITRNNLHLHLAEAVWKYKRRGETRGNKIRRLRDYLTR
jgi:hypothetical protein